MDLPERRDPRLTRRAFFHRAGHEIVDTVSPIREHPLIVLGLTLSVLSPLDGIAGYFLGHNDQEIVIGKFSRQDVRKMELGVGFVAALTGIGRHIFSRFY